MLEGIFEAPEVHESKPPVAVVCHPHPQYGGNMENNVAEALASGMLERGSACLRFNFRGTGRSQGTYGEGIAEIDDVKAALDYVTGRNDVDSKRIVVAGYSFGCWVGLKAASEDSRPGLLIGVSPPADMYDFSFLNDEKRPKFLVVGDRDFVCSTENFRKLTDTIPDPKQSAIIEGSDHFHFGREKYFMQEVHRFLDDFSFPGT